MANLVDLYVVYRILRRLTQPFTEWEAFKLGVIDAEGNILKKGDDRRTIAEKDSLTTFDVLMIKLKKLLAMVPGGKTRIASYAAALWLIKEEKNLTEENFEEEFRKHRLNEQFTKKLLKEEAPVNAVGGGNIAGTGDDAPVGKKAQMALVRRAKFANNDVFVVDTERFNKARLGKKKYLKYETYVGNDEIGNEIRQFGRKYPKKPIILQDDKTGAMIFLRYGRSGMFTESFLN